LVSEEVVTVWNRIKLSNGEFGYKHPKSEVA
jgi:hypothetical protein